MLETPTFVTSLSESGGSYPFALLAERVRSRMDSKLLFVLDARLDRTLVDVGSELGVTRERVRQLEVKAQEQFERLVVPWAAPLVAGWHALLHGLAVSQDALFEQLRHPLVPASIQDRLGELVLVCVIPEACHPADFSGKSLSAWWSTNKSALSKRLRSLSRECPIEDSALDAVLKRMEIPQDLPARTLLGGPHSPIRFHSEVRTWVRARAFHRDAAVQILRDQGTPMSATDLASRLGMNAHAANGNLYRDSRVRQIRPSGRWALTDWHCDRDDEPGFNSTIEAVIGILREYGPLSRKALITKVMNVYPVSSWAVQNALSSDLLGKTEYGDWDLAERGAKHAPTKRNPLRPAAICESTDGRLVHLTRAVDRELLRGSSLAVGRFLGWRMGLERPGDNRVFSCLGQAPLTVRLSFGSCSISTLRRQASELGATLGAQLVVTFDLVTDHYVVRLLTSNAEPKIDCKLKEKGVSG